MFPNVLRKLLLTVFNSDIFLLEGFFVTVEARGGGAPLWSSGRTLQFMPIGNTVSQNFREGGHHLKSTLNAVSNQINLIFILLKVNVKN